MPSLRKVVLTVSSVVVASLVFGMAAAWASHFRASTSTLAYDSSTHTLTWSVDSAWRKGRDDQMLYGPGSVSITDANGNDVSSSVTTTVPDAVQDTTNPLYDLDHDTVEMDVTNLLTTPGTYSAYVSSCCRVFGVVNTSGNDSFSQAASWTVNPDGSVDLPPTFTQTSLYALLPIGSSSSFTHSFTATDAENETVTYSQMTDTNAPDYGATTMPCSTFVNGTLTVSSSLCTGSDDYSSIYTAGAFFAIKVRATDTSGDYTETDMLLRVPTAPAPSISGIDTTSTTATVAITTTDTVVDSYSVTCTNDADSTDVVTATSTTQPVTVTGLQPTSSYTCVASATNGMGTNSSDPASAQTLTPQAITFAQPADVHLADGTTTVSGTSDAGLPVTYSTSTPSVCTVDPSTGVVTLVAAGTCTVAADAAGDSTHDAAPQVAHSFTVLPAAPVAGTPNSTGDSDSTQNVTVTVPSGGSITLLTSDGTPTDTVTIAHVGTFTLDPSTGEISFVPSADNHGGTTTVDFRVTDAYGQTDDGVYSAVVHYVPPAITVGTPKLSAPAVVHAAPVINTICSQASTASTAARLTACTVVARAFSNGHLVVVGQGTRTIGGSGWKAFAVPVTLNALGKALANRPGGMTAYFAAVVHQAGISAPHAASARSLVVSKDVALRPVFFRYDASNLTPQANTTIAAIRAAFGPVRSITCTGYADYAGNTAHEKALSKARAESVCAALVRGHSGVARHVVAFGPTDRFAKGGTPQSRVGNRRVEVVLHY